MRLKKAIAFSLCYLGLIFQANSQIPLEKILLKADSFGSIEQYDSCHRLLGKVILMYSEGNAKQKASIRGHYLKALDFQCYYFGEEERNVKSAEVGLQLVDLAQQYNYPNIESTAHLSLALVYEKMGKMTKCRNHLNSANNLIETNKLDALVAYHSVRFSSYLRLIGEPDSSKFYAEQAIEYGERFNQTKYVADGYFLLSSYFRKDSDKSIEYYIKAAEAFRDLGKLSAVAFMYGNVSRSLHDKGDFEKSKLYSDTALSLLRQSPNPIPSSMYLHRAEVLRDMGKSDEAYIQLENAMDMYSKELAREQETKVTELTLEYKTAKQNQIIEQQIELNKSERKRFIGAMVILLILVMVVVLYFIANRRIKNQNRLISEKTQELEESVKQKDSLLHEIHHRLKNNLQMVVSLLDIQKRNNNNKSQEEILNETKNRILSMSYLHTHLYENDDFSNINIEQYLRDISRLINQSYHNQKVRIEIDSRAVHLSIDKSLPLGLIVVELLSNSFKYAFKTTPNPEIQIRIVKNENKPYQYRLIYKDNGSGFKEERNTVYEGVGLKLIYGFAEQLDGVVKFETNKCMCVTLDFS